VQTVQQSKKGGVRIATLGVLAQAQVQSTTKNRSPTKIITYGAAWKFIMRLRLRSVGSNDQTVNPDPTRVNQQRSNASDSKPTSNGGKKNRAKINK
jgi:hypothetical protein